MRLLNTKTFEVRLVHEITEDQDSFDEPVYDILSHRWFDKEITFDNAALLRDESTGHGPFAASFHKIRRACRVASDENKIEWIWIDNVCIDKANVKELDMSINSMFRWYRNARVCYVYLQDVAWSGAIGPGMFNREDNQGLVSEWFERGWTLQELIAPRDAMFYNKNWKRLGTKVELADLLRKYTLISQAVLTGRTELDDVSVSSKMSWMAGRTTTYVEDIAYSLLGILNVTLTPTYGEGTGAFARLQQALLQSPSFDESVFAWKAPSSGELKCFEKRKKAKNGTLLRQAWKWSPSDHRWGLLAPSPDCFGAVEVIVIKDRVTTRLEGGFKFTNQGIYIALPYKETKTLMGLDKKELSLALNCWRSDTGRNVIIQLSRPSRSDPVWTREQIDKLDSANATIGTNRAFGISQVVTGPVTVAQPSLPQYV